MDSAVNATLIRPAVATDTVENVTRILVDTAAADRTAENTTAHRTSRPRIVIERQFVCSGEM